VRARDEVAYRLALAEGFLAEAEQDMELERWRSCVNNAQLVVENAGKAVLAWFGAVPKTHDPAQRIAALLRTQALPKTIQETIRR
jgi:HEPN domain-containing protein